MKLNHYEMLQTLQHKFPGLCRCEDGMLFFGDNKLSCVIDGVVRDPDCYAIILDEIKSYLLKYGFVFRGYVNVEYTYVFDIHDSEAHDNGRPCNFTGESKIGECMAALLALDDLHARFPR